MLARGLTTFAERYEAPGNPSRSDCHAWSASPNFEVFRTVLGIDTAAPGFQRVRIRPFLGELERVSGSIPHPKGEISVTLERTGSRLRAEIALPARRDRRVRLERCPAPAPIRAERVHRGGVAMTVSNCRTVKRAATALACCWPAFGPQLRAANPRRAPRLRGRTSSGSRPRISAPTWAPTVTRTRSRPRWIGSRARAPGSPTPSRRRRSARRAVRPSSRGCIRPPSGPCTCGPRRCRRPASRRSPSISGRQATTAPTARRPTTTSRRRHPTAPRTPCGTTRAIRPTGGTGRIPQQPFFAVFNILTTHESQIRLEDAQFARLTAALPPGARHDPARARIPPVLSGYASRQEGLGDGTTI